MDQHRREKWERTRSKGIVRFVLLWGLLLGGSMFIASSLFDYFLDSPWANYERLLIRMTIFLTTGLASGIIMWFVSEHYYRKGS